MTTPAIKAATFELALTLADDALILGHRLSEWSGQAPMLEEDIALSNLGLDLIGQARAFYTYAGELEGKGRDEDDLGSAQRCDHRAARRAVDPHGRLADQ